MGKKNVLIFVLFGIITLLIGFNWFMWGPILKEFVEEGMGVKPVIAEFLITSVPLLLVLFSYFTGSFADVSPKKSTITASILLGVFVFLRGVFASSVLLMFLFHFLFALSATFAFASWSPLSYRLFSQDKASKVTAYFTAFLVLGQILAFFISYPLAKGLGLKLYLILCGIVSVVFSLIYIVSVLNWDDTILNVEVNKKLPIIEGFRLVFSNKSLIILSLISFFDIGVFKYLAGWYPKLNVIFKGLEPSKAGFINAFILIGCLIGAMTIPSLSHKLKKVSIFFIILPLVVVVSLLLSLYLNSLGYLLFVSLILGIALFPIYPLGLHLPSAFRNLGVKYAGVGSGIILIFANLGGGIFPLLGVLTKTFTSSLVVFGIIPMVIISILGFFFKDPDTY